MVKKTKEIPTDHDLKVIYDVMKSDDRKHYILFDRCNGVDYCFPVWCDTGWMHNSYPYCSAERPAPRGIIAAAVGRGRRIIGMCKSVMYPGMCVRCMCKTGYNISPAVKANNLFIAKDNDKMRQTIIQHGGMMFI